MSAKRQAALGFIFVTVLLDMLAFGVAAAPLPNWLLASNFSAAVSPATAESN